jgi:hypothetical protein
MGIQLKMKWEFSFRGWVEKLKSGLRLGVRLGGVEFSFRGWVEKLKSGLRLRVRLGGVEFSFF